MDARLEPESGIESINNRSPNWRQSNRQPLPTSHLTSHSHIPGTVTGNDPWQSQSSFDGGSHITSQHNSRPRPPPSQPGYIYGAGAPQQQEHFPIGGANGLGITGTHWRTSPGTGDPRPMLEPLSARAGSSSIAGGQSVAASSFYTPRAGPSSLTGIQGQGTTTARKKGMTVLDKKRAAVGLNGHPTCEDTRQRRASIVIRMEEVRARNVYGTRLSTLRRKAFLITRSVWFLRIVFVLVLLNCIYLAANEPRYSYASLSSSTRLFYTICDWFFACAFSIEAIIILLAVGVSGPYAYFKSPRRWLELISTLVCWVDVFVDLNSYHYLPGIRAIRALRLFVFFRAVKSFRMVGRALKHAAHNMLPLGIFIGLLFIIFGSFWTWRYHGAFEQRCIPDAQGMAILQDPNNIDYAQVQVSG